MKRNPEDLKYRYFSCVEGHIVPRHGMPNQYIGARLEPSGETGGRSLLGPSGQGSFVWVWDTKKVERIPEEEFTHYGREYNRALKDKSLKERKIKDYDSFIKESEAAVTKAAKDMAAEEKAADESTATEPTRSDKEKSK